ncbi:MAG: glycosyltransferase [Saprospiraceae bacterium]|nr:glycosyltransferase [Saprospiraceae bacterium]
MKILLLTKKFPFPVKDGESLAINNLSRALHDLGCTLDLLAMNTPKHAYVGTDPHRDLPQFQHIQLVEVDTGIRVLDAAKNLFTSDSYNISRFVSINYTRALENLLKKNTYDIIQLETLFLAPYISCIRKFSKAPVVMRAHNVEHEIWERIADNTPASLKRWYIRHLTKRLRQYEVSQLSNYDLMAPITSRDKTRFEGFGYTGKSVVTPIGMDLTDYQADPSSFKRPLSLSFIGSLDWMPNLEGLKWFLEHVWQQAIRQVPEISLHVAGRNTPEWLHQLATKHLQIPGEVPDAHAFINQHSVMIVPLLSGSGMRAKILEGMALGKVVITTSIGLEGIEATHRREVLVANTPDEFVQAIRYCKNLSAGKLFEIGQKARDLVEEKYSNERIAGKLQAAYSTHSMGAVRL